MVTVSIDVSDASGVIRTVLTLDFFFVEALVTGSTGFSVMLGGIGAVNDAGIYVGVLSGSVLFAGEAVAVAVAVFSFAFWGDFFFFLVTSAQPSSGFFRLGLTRLLCCYVGFAANFAADGSCGDCCCCGSCGGRGSCSI